MCERLIDSHFAQLASFNSQPAASNHCCPCLQSYSIRSILPKKVRQWLTQDPLQDQSSQRDTGPWGTSAKSAVQRHLYEQEPVGFAAAISALVRCISAAATPGECALIRDPDVVLLQPILCTPGLHRSPTNESSYAAHALLACDDLGISRISHLDLYMLN
jgi:hypothetical protein